MPTRTIQEQVDSLLSRRVAEAKTRGTPNSTAEATAIFDSIALNLFLKPRVVLYLALLARNGLYHVVTAEIEAAQKLIAAINDLGNPSFVVQDPRALQEARVALLQMEGLSRINADSATFQRFDVAIQDFLESLSKTVRQPGQTQLARPQTEAAADLPADLESVVSLHEDLLDRLYSLRVGVQNFLTSSIGTVLGLATVTRVRQDVEDMIGIVSDDPASQVARDMAIRLISDRAAVEMVGSQPSPLAPVVDTVLKLPAGYSLTGRSDDGSAFDSSSTAPFTLPVSAQIQVTVGVTTILRNFPQHSVDLNNKAHVLGAAVVFPVTVPDQYYLFVSVFDGGGVETAFKIAVNISGSSVMLTLAQVLTALNTGLGANGVAVEFAEAGSNQILIYTSSPNVRIRINTTHTEIVAGIVYTYTNTVHSILGFSGAQEGIAGTTPLSTVVSAWNIFFDTLTTATPRQTDFTVTVVSTDPTVTLTIGGTGASSLGLAGTFRAKVQTLKLRGTTPTTTLVGEVSPVGLVQVGDILTSPTGEDAIQNVAASGIRLLNVMDGFDGAITVTSWVVSEYQELTAELFPFLEQTWFPSKFSDGLANLDSTIAALTSTPTPARRSAAISLLNELVLLLEDLQVPLTSASQLTGGDEERQIVAGVLATLQERKFDRAEDLLLRIKFQEFLALDAESASFGGNFLQSMTDFARRDLKFPNKSKDEGFRSKATRVNIGRDTT